MNIVLSGGLIGGQEVNGEFTEHQILEFNCENDILLYRVELKYNIAVFIGLK